MEYEWDEAKNRANMRKHGLGFEAVVRFEWSTAQVEFDDREDSGELREVAIGFLGESLHHLVFTRKDDDVIRVISFRSATKAEKRRYVEQTR